MPFRRIVVAAMVTVALAGSGTALAAPGPAAPVSDPPSATGDLPPVPYDGPVARVDRRHLVFFNAVALGARLADVRHRHPELHFERAGTAWIAMSPIGRHALTLTVTTDRQDQVALVTIANIQATDAASLAAHLARHLGTPWHDVTGTATSDQWETSAIRHYGNLPPNTRMALVADTRDGTAQITACRVDRQGQIVLP